MQCTGVVGYTRIMRYENVRDRFDAFQAAREACSREWELSDDTVMCLELDVGAASVRVDLESSFVKSDDLELFRITYYDMALDPPAGISGALLSASERTRADAFHAHIARWSRGEGDLPSSTSSRMASRVRRGARG